MGLLSTGTSMSWSDIVEWSEYIKKHGIVQFIHIFNSLKERNNDLLKYGDEIEYTMVYLDHENKDVRLDLRASEAITLLQEHERNKFKNLYSLWRMEYASFMLESTPGKPFCCTIARLRLIETSMWLRKLELTETLAKVDPCVSFICYSAFPRMGCPNFTQPRIDLSKSDNSISQSAFFPDEAIFLDHPRFANLTRNIRSRLGRKQRIYVPIWRDKNTATPFYDQIPPFSDAETRDSVIPDHVYMDCMGFGMGCSCLQVTVQAGNILEARRLYDEFAVVAPCLMALSACSPCWKGVLSEWDCRWKVISTACDDRTDQERDSTSPKYMHKSRYDSVDMYIHPQNEEFNDTPVSYSQEHYEMLRTAGIDHVLAKHISHIFCRDPISLFKEKIHLDDSIEVDHFENLQSTNWKSCRFKPPPLGSNIGWRVEFRTLEVQFTCYENAQFVIFIILLSRVILKLNLNLIIPISKMEQNMDRAITRDAINTSRFYFRKNIFPQINGQVSAPQICEMTLNEIFNGKKNQFIGLVPSIRNYISNLDLDKETNTCINNALRFISERASSKIMTPATWMRHFITTHPQYMGDSLVSSEILYDLTCKIQQISNGQVVCPKLYGTHKINKVSSQQIDAFKKMIQLESMNDTELKLGVLQRASSRPPSIKFFFDRLQVYEMLFEHYRFYNSPSLNRHLVDVFQ